jgi:hypothetical protein
MPRTHHLSGERVHDECDVGDVDGRHGIVSAA